MRIAQVAPLHESVPPRRYGGTERVVAYLVDELVAMGHDVTLFASGDSSTRAHLVACCDRALRTDDHCADRVAHHMLQLEAVMARASEFDVIHFHTDYLHYPFARRSPAPVVTTLHGRQDLRDLVPVYDEFGDVGLISISDHQRRPLPHVNWIATIHHGLPSDLLTPRSGARDYLAFLGRFSPEKRFDRAVEVARRTGLPLKAAAKTDAMDGAYFEEVVRPLLDDPLVEWVGEIGEDAKAEFLSGALAHLFPIDWPEPFGLVMIEAMACGTPTVAWRCGSVPEVIENGITGYVVSSVEDAVAAVDACKDIDRRACRAAFDRRFSAGRMAADYVLTYRRLCALRSPLKPAVGG